MHPATLSIPHLHPATLSTFVQNEQKASHVSFSTLSIITIPLLHLCICPPPYK